MERERAPVAEVPAAAVGVDVGLEKFATLSTGETIANPRFFRGGERDLKRAQRRLSEQPKGTPEQARTYIEIDPRGTSQRCHRCGRGECPKKPPCLSRGSSHPASCPCAFVVG
ncbi:MAG TPA: transposase [Roseiflexaceae bacterium]|nr:transposase [Roseiflexaceae bacterium]